MKPQVVFRILMFFGNLTCTWPEKQNVNKWRKLGNNFKRNFVLINVLGLLVPLSCAVYYHRQSITVMKTLSELNALSDVLFNLFLCRWQRDRLRKLLIEVEKYMESMKQDEEGEILGKFVNQYLPFCGFVGLSYFQTAIAFSCGPVIMPSILPADAWYPFPIQLFSLLYFSLYIQQVLAIIQTGMCITVDFMIAFLLSYLAARLEGLNRNFRWASNQKDLSACIRKHGDYIRYADELGIAVRFIILKSNVTMAMAAIFGAFPILYNEPLPVISQFILMVVGGCLRLYVTAWPADNVREISEKIAWSVYNSPWVGSSREMQKTISIVIHRTHRPLVISFPGVFPALTLKFYATFLSSTLSYFMTLRAVLHK